MRLVYVAVEIRNKVRGPVIEKGRAQRLRAREHLLDVPFILPGGTATAPHRQTFWQFCTLVVLSLLTIYTHSAASLVDFKIVGTRTTTQVRCLRGVKSLIEIPPIPHFGKPRTLPSRLRCR
jgi:hypothetical protein